MINAYSGKSTVMIFKENQENNKIYRDSAIYYLSKGYRLAEKHEKTLIPNTYSFIGVNMASHYYREWKSHSSEPMKDSLRKYINLVKSKYSSGKLRTDILASVMAMDAEVIGEDDPKKAIGILKEAYDLLYKEKPIPHYTMNNICDGLVILYKQIGDYKNALYYRDKNLAFNDSIYRKNQIETSLRNEAQFQNKKIKEDLEVAQKFSHQQKIRNILLVILVILLIGLSVYMYRYSKQKIKLSKEKALRVEQERQDALMKMKLEQEESKRLKAEQELLKFQNIKMEKENLAHALQVQRKNELLQKLNAQVAHTDVKKILKDEKRIDQSIENSFSEFAEINPKFFEKLIEAS